MINHHNSNFRHYPSLSLKQMVAHYLGNNTTKKELIVLKILADSNVEEGMVGAQILKESFGKLKRGTIYGLLERLEDKQLIKGEIMQENKRRYPQCRYTITQSGRGKLSETMDGIFTGILSMS